MSSQPQQAWPLVTKQLHKTYLNTLMGGVVAPCLVCLLQSRFEPLCSVLEPKTLYSHTASLYPAAGI